MANTWFSQIESYTFTDIKYNLKDKLTAPYPKLKCTTKGENTMPSVFPTLYMHILSPIEYAQDLENDEVNAVLATIEIQVFSNVSENDANKIMSDTISVMKNLRWNVISLPDPQTVDGVSFTIARFRQLVTETYINNAN